MNTYPAYLAGIEGAKDKDAIIAHVEHYIMRVHGLTAEWDKLAAENAALEIALKASGAGYERVCADRDEWKQQHENLLSVKAQDIAALCGKLDSERFVAQYMEAHRDRLFDERKALRRELLELQEKVSFLESREVCAAAHENVETCGYCQRDGLIGLIQLLSHNTDIPEHIRKDMLASHRYVDATSSVPQRISE